MQLVRCGRIRFATFQISYLCLKHQCQGQELASISVSHWLQLSVGPKRFLPYMGVCFFSFILLWNFTLFPSTLALRSWTLFRSFFSCGSLLKLSSITMIPPSQPLPKHSKLNNTSLQKKYNLPAPPFHPRTQSLRSDTQENGSLPRFQQRNTYLCFAP